MHGICNSIRVRYTSTAIVGLLLLCSGESQAGTAITNSQCKQFGGSLECEAPIKAPSTWNFNIIPVQYGSIYGIRPAPTLDGLIANIAGYYARKTGDDGYKFEFCSAAPTGAECGPDTPFYPNITKACSATFTVTPYIYASGGLKRICGVPATQTWNIHGSSVAVDACPEGTTPTSGPAYIAPNRYPFLCARLPVKTPGDDTGDPSSPEVTPPSPEPDLPEPPSPEPASPEVGSGGNGGSGETDECNGVVGDPISTATGSKFVIVTDYAPAFSSPLRLVRYYDSRMAVPGAFGSHWRHEYDRKIEVISAGKVKLRRADGKGLAFSLISGRWTSDSGSSFRLEAREGGQGWRVSTPKDEIEVYDAQGRLLQILAKGGMTLFAYYEPSGRLQNVRDGLGRQISFEYSSAGLVAAIVDPAGRRYEYSYDAKGNLISRAAPDGRTLQYHYQNLAFPNALTAVVDGNGVQIDTTFYDQNGRAYSNERTAGLDKVDIGYDSAGGAVVTSQGTTSYTFQLIQGVMKVTGMSRSCPDCGVAARSFERDERGNVTSRTDYNGVRTNYRYDADRNLEVSRTEAVGTATERTITTEWHAALHVPVRITEPGRVIEMAYDNDGNMVELAVVDAEGSEKRIWAYEYGEHGLLLSRTLPSGEKATYAYDSNGWLRSSTSAGGLVTQYLDYDPSGRVGRVVYPSGRMVAFTYDEVGRVMTRSEAVEQGMDGRRWWGLVIEWLRKLLGLDGGAPIAQGESGTAVSRYGYDSAGLLTDVWLPDGESLHYEYDAAYRLILARDALGNTIRIIRDPYGNPVETQVADAEGVLALSLQRTYDDLGRLSKVLGNNGQALAYRYDQEGYLLEQVNALGQRVLRSRDDSYRTTSIIDADNQSTSFEYNPLDQLITVADARGNETRYIRNAFGEVTGERSPDRGNILREYESARVKRITDARGIAHEYAYDADGRILSRTSSNSRVLYHYDSGEFGKGRLTGFDDASGSTRYNYNSRGQVTEKTSVIHKGSTLTTSYGYTLGGKLKEIATPGKHLFQFGYDANGRINHISVDGRPLLRDIRYGASGIVGWTWANGSVRSEQRDLDGRIVRIDSGNALSRVYGYDAANRLTTLVDTNADVNDRYGYDAVDRLVSQNGTGFSVSYDYDVLGNRIRKRVVSGGQASSTDYSYDPYSNRLLGEASNGKSISYSYLPSGQLSGDGGAVYSYSDEGRLAEVKGQRPLRNDYNALGQRVRKAGQSVLLFSYDESGRLLGEYTPGGVMVREYVWLGNRLVGMLSQQEKSILFVHADHLGTPRAVSDGSTVLWRWEGEAFGDSLPSEELVGKSRKLKMPLRFAGQYADEEIDNFYNYFRNYSARKGRYEEGDPLGLAGGINVYLYGSANPISFADPYGLYPGENIIEFLPDMVGADLDFFQNYMDMRDANTIGADKYFHCKANCEAAGRGLVGEIESKLNSEAREFLDEHIKGDSKAACDADRRANDHGRKGGANNPSGLSCQQVCQPFRPNGLPSQY